MKRRATNAVMMSPSRPSREAAEQAVNSVFDSCFRDTRFETQALTCLIVDHLMNCINRGHLNVVAVQNQIKTHSQLSPFFSSFVFELHSVELGHQSLFASPIRKTAFGLYSIVDFLNSAGFGFAYFVIQG